MQSPAAATVVQAYPRYCVIVPATAGAKADPRFNPAFMIPASKPYVARLSRSNPLMLQINEGWGLEGSI